MGLEVITPAVGEVPFFEKEPFAERDWRDGILVRTPNWLGDFVMCVPALMQLRKLLPESCALALAAPRGFEEVIEALGPLVQARFLLSDAHGFPTFPEFALLRSFHAGAGILFNNSFRDALWMKLLDVPRLYGAKARNRSFLLKRALAFSPRKDFVLNKPHQAAKYLALAELLGAEKWDGTLPELTLFREMEIYSDEVRASLQEEHLLALAPGAMYGSAKKWPPECYAEVCKAYLEKTKGRVALLSAKNEVESAKEAVAGLPPERVIFLAGKTTLGELMNILRHAEICLANDSGTMHLSALVGGRGISVFGSTDPAATSPISPKWRILYDKTECSPCFRRTCPKGTRECLYRVSPSAVIAEMEKMLEEPREERSL